MATGSLTPNMINAAPGLLPDSGSVLSLVINPALDTAINQYKNTPVISKFNEIYVKLSALDPLVYPGILDAFDSIGVVSTPPVPALTNRQPSINAGVPFKDASRWYTDIIQSTAKRILCYPVDPNDPNKFIDGFPDLSKFIQLYNICSAYAGQANEMVNSMNNTSVIGITFSNMEDLSSNNISQITSNFSTFGKDLIALGTLINLQDLDRQGYPSTLLRQILNTGGMLPGITTALAAEGVTIEILAGLLKNSSDLSATVERSMYRALTKVTGSDLILLLKLFDITTTGLETAADLLNPQKIYPTSYQTLRMTVPGQGQTNVYINGSVNSALQEFFATDDNYQTLNKIIPADWALATVAWIFSTGQVKNIKTTEFVKFSELVSKTENIGSAGSLATPLAQGTNTSINTALATGTGPGNTVTVYDSVGTAAGYPHVDVLAYVTAAWQNDLFVPLLVAYQDILDYLNSEAPLPDPSAPPPDPSAPPAPWPDPATLAEKVTVAVEVSNTLIADNQQFFIDANAKWKQSGDQLNREKLNQDYAELEYNELKAKSRSSVMAFVSNLHSIGKDTSVHGSAEFFSKIVNDSVTTGQAFIASMREGRNIASANDAGVGTDAMLDSSSG